MSRARPRVYARKRAEERAGADLCSGWFGCFRYEAHKRLGKETIPGKIIAVPASTMKQYLGAGSPF